MRTGVYIDGFNLYYGALRGTPYKWLDVRMLCTQLLKPDNKIGKINYYSSRVSGKVDPQAPERQHRYWRAIETIPGLRIFQGNFVRKEACKPLANPIPLVRPKELPQFMNVIHTVEKGSDVNLASHLLLDAFRGAFDVAVVVSGDGDLVEPIRIVRAELNKPVGLMVPCKASPYFQTFG